MLFRNNFTSRSAAQNEDDSVRLSLGPNHNFFALKLHLELGATLAFLIDSDWAKCITEISLTFEYTACENIDTECKDEKTG